MPEGRILIYFPLHKVARRIPFTSNFLMIIIYAISTYNNVCAQVVPREFMCLHTAPLLSRIFRWYCYAVFILLAMAYIP